MPRLPSRRTVLTTAGALAVIGGAAAVGQDVPAETIFIGYPAGPVPEKLQENMNLRRLPRLLREMMDFGKRLRTLERRLASSGGG